MPLKDKIFRFFMFGDLPAQGEVNPNRVILINSYCLLNISFSLIFLVLAAVNGELLLSIVLSGSILAFLLAVLYFNRTYNRHLTSNYLLVLTSLQVIFVFLYGGTEHTGFIWAFLYPLISFALSGMRKGSIYSIAFLGILMILLFVNPDFLHLNYSPGFAFRFILAYLAVYLLSFAFEYLRISNIERMDKALEEAEIEARSRDEFISGLSHQLRTSLNNITLVNNLVSELKLNEKQKDLIDTIIASTNNLVEAVNNIVDISSSEPWELKETKIPFDIYQTIDNILQLFSTREYSGLRISFNKDATLTNQLLGDPIRIKQLFLNLIENIIKEEKANRQTRIDISVRNRRETETRVELGFQLTVCFVEMGRKDAQEQAIPAGECLDTGLDIDYLGIPRRLVEKLGGRLEFTSGDGRTVFTFDLGFEKGEQVETKTDEQPSVRIEEISRKKKLDLKEASVLLVEDNLINQKIVILSLEKYVKTIHIAHNGKEALDKFGTSNYDLILMDIQMPVMDGILATKKIREIEESTSSYTPIIAITANAMSGDRETCLAVGMNDYISKPFQVDILVGKMKNLLENVKS